MADNVKVAIVAGSKSDQAVVDEAVKVLTELGVSHEVQFLSAHRNPEGLRRFLVGSKADIFIAIAGLAAHLPGVIASMTVKPVVGVPVNAKLDGLDSLLSIVQMPPGVPVACVGIDNARNAGILAAEMVALSDPTVKDKLEKMREAWR
ncbi:MAG TPA: 5-(carboxyamino)imidazole ribonucleotide mutase [Nitrososphaerales archaeon]|nr:5-(carboxyamino)imidazole ribonucleotide mutase [Nitrososphaerales archaeon]